MGRGKYNEYDDDELVLAIARGDIPYTRIAKHMGISEHTVGQIARGVRRPELLPKIQAARQAYTDQARGLAARLATQAVARLAKIIAPDLKPNSEVQRKAAVDILRYALGDPSRPQFNVIQAQKTEAPAIDPEDAAEYYRWKADKEGYEEPPATSPAYLPPACLQQVGREAGRHQPPGGSEADPAGEASDRAED